MSGLRFLILKVLHAAERKRVGKDAHPMVAVLDSQSVKTVEESAYPSGYDVHDNVKGCKRHLLIDTLGFPLSVYITSAYIQPPPYDPHASYYLAATTDAFPKY